MGINRFSLEDYRKYIPPRNNLVYNGEDAENASAESSNKLEGTENEYQQVNCDVERSLHNIYQLNYWTENERKDRRQALTDIIMAVLSKDKSKHYYQVEYLLFSFFSLLLSFLFSRDFMMSSQSFSLLLKMPIWHSLFLKQLAHYSLQIICKKISQTFVALCRF